MAAWPGWAGAVYGCAGAGLVMFICMFDENDLLAGLNEQQQRAVTHQGGPFTGQLAGLFRAYGARKRARHLLDFDDLLLLWQAALADPVAGPVLRGMFNAVLVEEYQDVNAVQASIVRLLQPDGDPSAPCGMAEALVL